jgi:hypothetical protein
MQEYDISFKGGQRGKWCADETNTVKCNRNAQGAWEKWKVVDLGNDKYAFKGGKDGKWCADEGPHGVKCNRNHIKSWETFTIERHGDRIALKGVRMASTVQTRVTESSVIDLMYRRGRNLNLLVLIFHVIAQVIKDAFILCLQAFFFRFQSSKILVECKNNIFSMGRVTSKVSSKMKIQR